LNREIQVNNGVITYIFYHMKRTSLFNITILFSFQYFFVLENKKSAFKTY